jgi:L-iditol 2-dehydrogenase
MKALVYREPNRVQLEDWPEPVPKPGEVLVKVAAAGLCGTDRHITDGTYSAARPVVLGHEFAGTVVAVHDTVEIITVGDNVCIDPNLPCHSCDRCHGGQSHLCRHLQAIGVTRDGGLASYAAVPALACHILPQGLTALHAILGEPLSCVIHALDRAKPRIGGRAAIWGLGTAGLMMVQCLRAMGQREIIGISHHESHRLLAMQMGATSALHPDDAQSGLEVDLAVEASGSPTAFAPALNALAPGGRLLQYGVMSPDDVVQVKPEQLFRLELQITGSFVGPGTLDRALSLIASGTVDAAALLGDAVSLEEAHQWLYHQGERKRAKVHVVFD